MTAKLFLWYDTKAQFEAAKSGLNQYQIVFIKETKQIYTRGQFFTCPDIDIVSEIGGTINVPTKYKWDATTTNSAFIADEGTGTVEFAYDVENDWYLITTNYTGETTIEELGGTVTDTTITFNIDDTWGTSWGTVVFTYDKANPKSIETKQVEKELLATNIPNEIAVDKYVKEHAVVDVKNNGTSIKDNNGEVSLYTTSTISSTNKLTTEADTLKSFPTTPETSGTIVVTNINNTSVVDSQVTIGDSEMAPAGVSYRWKYVGSYPAGLTTEILTIYTQTRNATNNETVIYLDKQCSNTTGKTVYQHEEAEGLTTTITLRANSGNYFYQYDTECQFYSRNIVATESGVANYVDSTVMPEIQTKADINDVYKKTEVYSKTETYNNTTIDELLTAKLSIAQGEDNAGKHLVVGSDGNVTLVESNIEIDDTTRSTEKVWSSSKTGTELDKKVETITAVEGITAKVASVPNTDVETWYLYSTPDWRGAWYSTTKPSDIYNKYAQIPSIWRYTAYNDTWTEYTDGYTVMVQGEYTAIKIPTISKVVPSVSIPTTDQLVEVPKNKHYFISGYDLKSSITNKADSSTVTTLSGRVDTAEGNITTLSGRVDTAEGNITTLSGRVDTAESDINSLQEVVPSAATSTNQLVDNDKMMETIRLNSTSYIGSNDTLSQSFDYLTEWGSDPKLESGPWYKMTADGVKDCNPTTGIYVTTNDYAIVLHDETLLYFMAHGFRYQRVKDGGEHSIMGGVRLPDGNVVAITPISTTAFKFTDNTKTYSENDIDYVISATGIYQTTNGVSEYDGGYSEEATPTAQYDIYMPTTRYVCTGAQTSSANPLWSFQYTISDSSMTSDQLAALNSGITSDKVSALDSHVADNDIHVTADDKTNWNSKANVYWCNGTETASVLQEKLANNNILLYKELDTSAYASSTTRIYQSSQSSSSRGGQVVVLYCVEHTTSYEGGTTYAHNLLRVINISTSWSKTSYDLDDEVLWVVEGTTTISDIDTAIANNKIVCVKRNGMIYMCGPKNGTANTYGFSCVNGATGYCGNYDGTSFAWYTANYQLKQTTISGYGITDAYTKTETKALYTGDITDYGKIEVVDNDDVTGKLIKISEAPFKKMNGGIVSTVYNSPGLAQNTNGGSANNDSTVIGAANTNTGDRSFVAGRSNTNSTSESIVAGLGLQVQDTSSAAVFGQYNQSLPGAQMVIGDGTAADNRSNAMVLRDGILGVKNDVYAGNAKYVYSADKDWHWEADHQLSQKVDDAPANDAVYARKNNGWTKVIDDTLGGTDSTWSSYKIANQMNRLCAEKGHVATKDLLPTGSNTSKTVYSNISNSSIIMNISLKTTAGDDHSVTGLILDMYPGEGTTDVWFRNAENWNRTSSTNLAIDGVTLADIGYTVTTGAFGQGNTHAEIDFDSVVSTSETSVITFTAMTWGAIYDGETHNNEYTLNQQTFALAGVKSNSIGDIYHVDNTEMSYIYDGNDWTPLSPEDLSSRVTTLESLSCDSLTVPITTGTASSYVINPASDVFVVYVTGIHQGTGTTTIKIGTTDFKRPIKLSFVWASGTAARSFAITYLDMSSGGRTDILSNSSDLSLTVGGASNNTKIVNYELLPIDYTFATSIGMSGGDPSAPSGTIYNYILRKL